MLIRQLEAIERLAPRMPLIGCVALRDQADAIRDTASTSLVIARPSRRGCRVPACDPPPPSGGRGQSVVNDGGLAFALIGVRQVIMRIEQTRPMTRARIA